MSICHQTILTWSNLLQEMNLSAQGNGDATEDNELEVATSSETTGHRYSE